jgi:hypothetical protein
MRSIILLPTIIRASGNCRSGPICPNFKTPRRCHGRCRGRVAAPSTKNFVTIVTRPGLLSTAVADAADRTCPSRIGLRCSCNAQISFSSSPFPKRAYVHALKGWRDLLPNQSFDEDILISHRDTATASRQFASTRLAEAPETVRARTGILEARALLKCHICIIVLR